MRRAGSTGAACGGGATAASGSAGARQVAGAETALVHGNGGTLSTQVTAILGTENVL